MLLSCTEHPSAAKNCLAWNIKQQCWDWEAPSWGSLQRETESLGLALSKLAVWSLANHLIPSPNSPTHKIHIYFDIKCSRKSFPNLRVFDSLDSSVSLSQQISKRTFAVKVTVVIHWFSVQCFIWIINNRFAQQVLGVPHMGATPWCGRGDPPEGPASVSSLLSLALQQKLWIPGALLSIWKFGQNPQSDHMVSRTCWDYSQLSVSLSLLFPQKLFKLPITWHRAHSVLRWLCHSVLGKSTESHPTEG